MKKIVFVIGCLWSITSCNMIQSSLQGYWSVNPIYLNGQNINYCLITNILSLSSDGTCKLPYTENCGDLVVFDQAGRWTISRVRDREVHLKFLTNNFIFNRGFKIRFIKDGGNKLLKMEMKSDSFNIICTKGLYDFDEHIQEINELVQATNI